MKTIRASQAKDILPTGFLRRETNFAFSEIARTILHWAANNRLGLPESAAYPPFNMFGLTVFARALRIARIVGRHHTLRSGKSRRPNCVKALVVNGAQGGFAKAPSGRNYWRHKFVAPSWLVFALIVAALLSTATAKAQGVPYKTRLNGVELWLDRQTGTLEYLSSRYTGTILNATRKESGMVDLAYPIPEFTPLRLASRFSHARVVPQSNGVRIIYSSLGSSRKTFPLPPGRVTAEVTVRAADDGKSVIFSCRIENHSQASVPQVLFPDLWGLIPFNGVKGTQLRLARGVERPFATPFYNPESVPPYYDRVGWKEYPAGGYYSENALRWLDFGGLAGGLSVFQKEWRTLDRPDVLTYRSEGHPLHLRLAWEHKVTIKPGQTWDSGEFWLTPHPGGWAKGIEVYRRYVNQVNPAHPLPIHVRNGLGFQTIWMTQALEKDPNKAYFRYRDLPRVARDAKQYGLDELVPWFWSKNHFSMQIRYSPMLGTEKELLSGINQAKALGVNVAPFVSIHTVNNGDVARYGVKPGDANWTYDPQLIPQFRPYYAHNLEGTYISDDNPTWQHDVKAALAEWINKGLDSFTFDQFGYKELAGEKPALIKVINQVRSAARVHDPQSTFGGESLTNLEWDSSVLDYTWNWVGYVDAGPLVAVLRSPRLNCDIDDSPLVAKKCFAEGLYLNVMPSKTDAPNGTALVSEKPALAATLKDLAAMRKRYLPFFVEGHALGDSVLSQPASAFVRAYQMPGRLLVFVLNDRQEPRQVVLRIDLSLWLPKAGEFQVSEFNEKGRLTNHSRAEGARWVAITSLLKSGAMSVFEVQPEQVKHRGILPAKRPGLRDNSAGQKRQ